MKLPEISPVGSTEKLTTVNPMLAVTGEGRAMGEAFSKIGNVIYKKGMEIYQNEQIARTEEFNLLLKENEAQWHKENDGKEEYSIDELSPSTKEALGISEERYPDGIVPGYVVKPHLKRQSMTDAMRNNASMISDPELRRSALTRAKEHEISAYQNQVRLSIKNQKIYHRNKTLTKYEEYMAQGDFVMAAETAVNSTLDGDEKIRLQRRALGRQQASVLNDVLWSDNIKAMKAMKKRIMDNDPTAMGYLSDSQQRGFISAVNTRIDQMARAAREAAASSRRLMTQQTNWTISLLNSGHPVNIDLLSRQAKFAQKHNPTQYNNLLLAYKNYSTNVKVKDMPLMEQMQKANELRSTIGDMDPMAAMGAAATINMIEQDARKRPKDPIGWAQENGYPVAPFDVKNVDGAIVGRLNLTETLNRKYHTTKHPLSKEDQVTYSEYLETLSTDQLLEEGIKINTAYSGDKNSVLAFWEPFKAQGLAGVTPMAAQLTRKGFRAAGRKALVGTDYMRKNPAVFPTTTKSDFAAEAQKVFGPIFGSNAPEMTARLKAAEGIYVANMVANGDTSGEFDRTIASAAIAAAAGPTLKYKGKTLPAAVGTTGAETERWFDTMSPRELELFGADPKHSQMFVDGMRSGKYTIVSVDETQFSLIEGEGQSISSCKDINGSPLLFSYRDGYITTADDEADVKAFYAKRIAEGKSVGFTKYERPKVDEPNPMQMTDPGVTEPPPDDPTFTETNLMD